MAASDLPESQPEGPLPSTGAAGPRHSFSPWHDHHHLYRVDAADELLAARIQRSLMATGRRHIAELRVVVHQGHVRMAGTVPSYYAKQLAHQAVLAVDGIERIDCDIEVD
ncbi:BON domain-containing protein [Planctomicrobium sp. SH661]|uniref:BON domain-containing protein n=1 Tax=Planctomicrobium sp. SH661 TaxID=3448124 RepID=UPI003F5B6C73